MFRPTARFGNYFTGAYSDSYGLDVVRRDIAAYINERDDADIADFLSSPQGTCTFISISFSAHVFGVLHTCSPLVALR